MFCHIWYLLPDADAIHFILVRSIVKSCIKIEYGKQIGISVKQTKYDVELWITRRMVLHIYIQLYK